MAKTIVRLVAESYIELWERNRIAFVLNISQIAISIGVIMIAILR